MKRIFLVFFCLSLGLVGSLPAIQKMQITEPSQLPEDRMLPDIPWPQSLIQKIEGLHVELVGYLKSENHEMYVSRMEEFLNEEIHDTESLLVLNYTIGQMCRFVAYEKSDADVRRRWYQKAVGFNKTAIELARTDSSKFKPYLVRCYFGLAECYDGLEEKNLALDMYQRLVGFKGVGHGKLKDDLASGGIGNVVRLWRDLQRDPVELRKYLRNIATSNMDNEIGFVALQKLVDFDLLEGNLQIARTTLNELKMRYGDIQKLGGQMPSLQIKGLEDQFNIAEKSKHKEPGHKH